MGRLATPALILAVIFAAIQLVPVDHSAAPATGELAAPPEVARILDAACYDCHSVRTRWPWYSRVAPVSWLAAHHVAAGRRRLNFSDWADYASDPGTLAHKLDEIQEAVADGSMAPWYYRMLHREARLSAAERRAIALWAAGAAAAARRADSSQKDSR